MGKLNYNKWDNLELSDDSDIEVHPNVDKQSMIRWKQRDIHEKREIAKLKIYHLGQEKIMNDGLLKRIESLISGATDGGVDFIIKTIAQLRVEVPDYDPKKNDWKDGEQPSENWMILSLLQQVSAAVGGAPSTARVLEELNIHKQRLLDRNTDVEKERTELEEEQQRKITTDSLHVGFESKTMISNKPAFVPEPDRVVKEEIGQVPERAKAGAKAATGKGSTSTQITTINAPSATTTHTDIETLDTSDEDVPKLTPALHRFSIIPSLNFEKMFAALSDDPANLLREEATDALFVEAFSVIMKAHGKPERDVRAAELFARNCIEKGLALQYCRQLGRDGVSVFFKRMGVPNSPGLKMFLDDCEKTSKRVIERARVVAAEEKESREQIQLVASDPSVTISFEVPDGPAPAELEITGEGSENLDMDAVRAFLDQRWAYFTSFSPELQEALRSKDLEAVNKVLGDMPVAEAEEVVTKLQEGGILSFSEDGVRDMTQQ